MSVSRRINFDEPIPDFIARLKSEHVIFESKFIEIDNNIKQNDIKKAAQLIQDLSDKIIQHAVEEEEAYAYYHA